MSTNSIIVELGIVIGQINRYVLGSLVVIGIIGNIFNCMIFTRRDLRSTPCAMYFLAASLLNFIVIATLLIPRTLGGWGEQYDLTQTITVLCKIACFLLFAARGSAAWLIAFATVDRYLISSPDIHRRQISTAKNTYRCILIICTILFAVWSEQLYCYDANVIGTPLKCYPKSNTCRIYNNFAQAFIIVLIPVSIMFFFGFLTIRNIQQSGRIAPNNSNENATRRNRRRENSLTKMLLSQVLTITLAGLPFALMAFYISLTYYQEKTIFRSAIENFTFNMLLILAYVPNYTSFFLFTLSGSLFRETFIDLMKKIGQFFRC